MNSFPVNLSSNNIQLVTVPLSEVNVRIASKFNGSEPISADFPYKLCDYKPMFADIFPDIVTSEYDFWGHIDVR
jgi:hypothetical protein